MKEVSALDEEADALIAEADALHEETQTLIAEYRAETAQLKRTLEVAKAFRSATKRKERHLVN